MISSLHVENFQSHMGSTLNFHPGVNVIVGSSDSGKTALLRSIIWVVNNRPLGTAYIRTGSSRTRVTVTLNPHYGGNASADLPEAAPAGQLTILRERSARKNLYEVNGVTYDTPARDVPPEVTQAFGMSDLNLQAQLDQPFLILDSPGEIAAWVNKVTKLDKVDDLILDLARKLNEWKDSVVRTKADVEILEDRLSGKQFMNLDLYERLVGQYDQHVETKDSLEELLESILSITSRIGDVDDQLVATRLPIGIADRASDLYDEAKALTWNRKDLAGWLDNLIQLHADIGVVEAQWENLYDPPRLAEEVAKLEAEARKLTERRRELGHAQYELENIRQGLASVGTQLSRIHMPSGIAEEIAHLADRTRVLANSKQELGKQLKGLLLNTQDVQGLEDMLARHDAELEETKVEYRKALDGLSVCPTCKTLLSADRKAEVIESLTHEA